MTDQTPTDPIRDEAVKVIAEAIEAAASKARLDTRIDEIKAPDQRLRRAS